MIHRLIITIKYRSGFFFLILSLLVLAQFGLARASLPAQIPTGSIPTVTGTPVGALAVVLANDQGFINVRGYRVGLGCWFAGRSGGVRLASTPTPLARCDSGGFARGDEQSS